MGNATERSEQMANPLFIENGIAQNRFNSVEAFAGFGMNIRFLKKFKWTNSIGVGGCTSFNFPTHLYYYKGQTMGVALRTGITMNINK